MLPYFGYIKPTDKKSLTSLQDDIQDYCKRKINIETGQIYLDVSGEDAPSADPYTAKDPLSYEYNIFLSKNMTSYSKKGDQALKGIDLEFTPVMPNNEEIKILEAQHYAARLKADELTKRGIDVLKLKLSRAEGFDVENAYKPIDIDPEIDLNGPELERFSQSFENFKVDYFLCCNLY